MKRIPNKFNLIVWLISLAFVIGGWLWAYLAFKHSSGPLITHYTPLSGISSLGGRSELSEVGTFGLLVVLMNSWLAFELDKRGRFWGALVTGITFLFSVLIFIGFGAIISVNY